MSRAAALRALPAAKAAKTPDLSSRLAVTVSEAARLLGISGASVRHLIRTGRLKGISFGTGHKEEAFIISLESLRAFLSGAEVAAAQK
jgi:excisionase family DNA binding protein